MSDMCDIIDNSIVLDQLIDEFIDSIELTKVVLISQDMRRHMRNKSYSIRYFAYNLGHHNELILSKIPIIIDLSKITKKSFELFEQSTGVNIPLALKCSEDIQHELNLEYYKSLFIDALLKTQGELEFRNLHHKLNDLVTNYIAKRIKETNFDKKVLPDMSQLYKLKPPKGTLYKPDNSSLKFLSIDMKSANFQVLRNNKLIDHNTYSDFISTFTSIKYYQVAKGLRQKILSSTSSLPKKQSKEWEYIILCVLRDIIDIIKLKIICVNSDELVFALDDHDPEQKSAVVKKFLDEKYPEYQFGIDTFTLIHITNTRGYVKINTETSSRTWKCISNVEFKHAYNAYMSMIDNQ